MRARATLDCDGHSVTAETNSEGSFAFGPRAQFQGCTLTVAHSGFAAFKQTLGKNAGNLVIRLRLLQTNYIVTVSAKIENLRPLNPSTLASTSLSEAELRSISNNTADLIRYARQLAGATTGPDNIYVDGMPSSSLPPAELVARITVNPDPFSAEYADGDQTHIEITTKAPGRKLRFHFGGASLGSGGRSPLATGIRSLSSGGDFGLTGPLFRLPVSFSLQTNLACNETPQPTLAVTLQPPSTTAGTQRARSSTSCMGAMSLILAYSKAERLGINFAYSESRAKSSNVGVGGLTLAEAGLNSAYGTREARLTFSESAPNYIYQGGVSLDVTSLRSHANTNSLGVVVTGSFVGGGAAVTDDRQQKSHWTWRNVVQFGARKRLWAAGVTISRFSDFAKELPNPAGVIQFESLPSYFQGLAGAPLGTWEVTRGNATIAHASMIAAPFLEGDLLASENALVRAGIRVDYQTKGGVLLSPRLSAAAKERGFILRTGAGMFVHEWANDIFVQIIQNDGQHFQRFLVHGVSFADVSAFHVSGSPTLVSQPARDLIRPRNWMLKASLERPMGSVTAGLEYTWTSGSRLLGSRRTLSQTGFVDRLESNRSMRKHQVHASLRFQWKDQFLVGHYEWIGSRDSSDGPFSFPERQDNLRAEWARSTGVPAHNVSVVGSFKLRGGVSLTLVGTLRSSIPYNITTGVDSEHNALYNDRAGRERNSGNGPSYRSLSLYAYRRILVPHLFVKSKKKMYIDAGLQVDNLLDSKSYTSVGSVLGSPLFGKPLAALPGRSVRFWFGFNQ